jgi:hypothetical protein
MHSLVGIFRMDPALRARQRAELDERIVPLVKHQPGFVSASWSYDSEQHRGFAVLIFDSERAARGMAEYVREQMTQGNDTGVQLDSLVVAEVDAQVRR